MPTIQQEIEQAVYMADMATEWEDELFRHLNSCVDPDCELGCLEVDDELLPL